MRHDVELTVNGTPVTATVEARQLLVHLLREDLGLTGTHVGCDSSNCGACTVMLDGEAVKSCTVLTVAAAGASVLTIEGLATDEESLTPVQQGFRECHGLQCGYCTPGMVMAATSLLLDNPDPLTRPDPHRAPGQPLPVHRLPDDRGVGALGGRQRRPRRGGARRASGGVVVIPSPFSYVRARSVDHALDLLVEHGDEGKLLCGGHSLLPLMKLRLANPATLIDIRTLPELHGIRSDGDRLHIGAATRHRDLELDAAVVRRAPLLARAAETIGDPQIRARGTIGGSIVHGDPAADLPAALLALDATVTLRGPRGTREVALEDFFLDFWQTAIAPDEVLTTVTVPSNEDVPVSFVKFHQRAQDWAIVGVAALGGASPRVALVNMAATPWRARAVEQALADGADIAEAAALADVGTAPSTDLRADATYRRHLARVITERALAQVV